MPLQGVFNADFTAFTNACAQAEVSLRGFETGASKTESALNKMADSISGTKIVQQAMLATKAVEDVGGAAVLTEKELARMSDMAAQGAEKLTKMGQVVPPQMQELANRTKDTAEATMGWSSALTTAQGVLGAFGIQTGLAAIVNFGKGILEDADALTKMHDKTGISVEALQALRIAGDDAGVSLDSMTTAVNMLQKRLGGDDNSAAAALRDLGIDIEHFKSLDGAAQMLAISDAIREMHDPLRVAADLSALFGKQWAEQLPVLKRGFEELKDGTGQMSAAAVKYWDDLGDHIQKTSRTWTAAIGEMTFKVLDNSLTGGLLALNSTLEQMQQKAEKAAPALGGMVPPGLPKDLQEITDKSDAWAASSKAINEAMVELDSAGKGWQGTLNTINGDVVEAVKWYLEAGVSQRALATAFGLTDVQVKAIDSSMKDYTETLKAVLKIEGDHVKQGETNYLGLSKAENDYTQKRLENEGKAADQLIAIDKRLTDEYNQQTMSRGEYASQKLWEAADAQIAAFQKTGATAEQVTQFSNKVYEETALKASEIDYAAGQTITDITNKAVEGVQKMAAAGASALETLQGGEKLPGSTTEQAFGQNYLVSPTGARVPLGPHGEIPKNFDALYSGKSSFPQFAGGVQNFSGGLALVGEKGPELVNLPSGSDVIPNSRMGGGGVSITIHVTQPFGTPEAIARAVADAQVSLMRGQGVRLPYGT
jgi:hypothetical protein